MCAVLCACAAAAPFQKAPAQTEGRRREVGGGLNERGTSAAMRHACDRDATSSGWCGRAKWQPPSPASGVRAPVAAQAQRFHALHPAPPHLALSAPPHCVPALARLAGYGGKGNEAVGVRGVGFKQGRRRRRQGHHPHQQRRHAALVHAALVAVFGGLGQVEACVGGNC